MITKANFPYSLKNVPLPHKATYMKGVISASESFLQNIRWKVFHHLKEKSPPKKPQTQTFGFKTPHNAPYIHQLNSFENDMNHLISNLEFIDKQSPFQLKLSRDTKKLKCSNNLFVQADKTSNVYEIDKQTYNKLMLDNLTANYKKADQTTLDEINKKASYLTDSLLTDF